METHVVETPMVDHELGIERGKMIVPSDRDLPSPKRLYKQGGRWVSPDFRCCIYKVPEFIRKEKEECYQPSVISIGPVFYGDSHLQTMEVLKRIYLESFLQIPNNACQSFDEYVNIVREYEMEIRDCYQEQKVLSSEEFIKMVVLDAVFLLRLFMETLDDNKSPLPNKVLVLTPFIRRDLFLVENQLPFFVLELVFCAAFPTEQTFSLINLTFNFIRRKILPTSKLYIHWDPDDSHYVIAHLLDFWCKCCIPIETEPREKEHVTVTIRGKGDTSNNESQPNNKPQQKLPMTASQLSAAGIKFKQTHSAASLEIKFDNSTGVLKVPELVLEDFTETYFQNFLFFERCHYFSKSPSCMIDLVIFLLGLIDSVKDIQILQQNGILNNLLGSDEEVANLFNSITKNTAFFSNHFKYGGITQEVNAFANKPWNQWKAILRRDYFSHPWALISLIYAIIILILIVLQTITGFTMD